MVQDRVVAIREMEESERGRGREHVCGSCRSHDAFVRQRAIMKDEHK